jgi:trigger factor
MEVMNNQDYELQLEADVSYPLPGFHERIVGMTPGEEKTFVLPVPEDDEDTEAAGQEATITVLVHSIKERDLPPLDDELALMVGDYDTLDDLKAGVREQMETEALQKAESEYLDKALDAFIEAAPQIEYPPQAVDHEVEQALNQMEGNLAGSGIELNTYLGMLGKTRATYSQELRPMAEERLKKRLVLRELVELENLQIDTEEVEAQMEQMITSMGPQGEEMRQVVDSPGGRMMIADDLMTAKAQERAVQIAKGEAPPLEEDAEVAEPETAAEAETETDAETVLEVETTGDEEERPEEEAEVEFEAEREDEPVAQAQAEPEDAEAAPEPASEAEGHDADPEPDGAE